MSDNFKMEQGVASRIAAAQLVDRVLTHHDTIDESLTRIATKMRLSDEDRRLVHAISGNIFRKLPFIDTVLRRLMDRGRDPKPPMLHHLLRVGVAQLLYMAVAEHAAVDTTVSATGSLRLERQKGLVNAVLRSVQRQKADLMKDEPDALGMLPEWLGNRWISAYGESEARALAGAMAQEAPLDLTIKDAHASHEWAQTLGGETLLPDSLRVHQQGGQVNSWPGFIDGAWWVQDLAASIPIRLLGDVTDKSVVDVCAAPGGKTQQLASLGARVTALDVAPLRMTRVSENLKRLRLDQRVKTVITDARTWRTDLRFDIAVVDVPCSSTGTLRRHPELPWIHEEIALEKLGEAQRDLLRHASELLVHDGIMLYCTCSMEVEEGENQVEAFLNAHKDFKEIKNIPAVVHPYVRTGINNIGFRTNPAALAASGGMDGFFMALLKKI